MRLLFPFHPVTDTNEFLIPPFVQNRLSCSYSLSDLGALQQSVMGVEMSSLGLWYWGQNRESWEKESVSLDFEAEGLRRL